MHIIGLLIDDSFCQGNCFAKEARFIVFIRDDKTIQEGENKGDNCYFENIVCECLTRIETLFHTLNETVSSQVVRKAASCDHVARLNSLRIHECLHA